MKKPANPGASWAWRMAWRDGRKSWRRFLLYISAVSLGIGTLIAADSFRRNLEEALKQQAKPLLGADLVVGDRRPFDAEADSFFASLPYPRFKEIRLNTVAFFPKADAGRILEVRAVEPGFPFYGDVHTAPAGILPRIFEGPVALVEESVLAEFDLKLGDAVQIGSAEFAVAGSLSAVPGEAIASVFAAPRVYIGMEFLPATALESKESLSRHRVHFKIEDEAELARALAALGPRAEKEGWRLITVEERRRSLGRRAGNAGRFLKLAALIMLLLGGIGVASIIYVYVKDKFSMAATLRCLGAPASSTFGIFLIQGAFLGLAGAAGGIAAGVGLQAVLPRLAGQFLKIQVPFFISWASIANGAAVGFGLAFLFTIFPLLGLRAVTPLAAFRREYEAGRSALKDPAAWLCAAALAALLFFSARTETSRAWMAAAVPGGILAALLVLLGMTRLALSWLRRRTPARWPYAWRQGLANLFRPNNQTYVLVSALGLGAAFLFSISFLHNSLLSQITLSTGEDQPTIALVDVQSDQREAVRGLLTGLGLPVTHEAPIVSMRIETLKGRPVEELRREDKIPSWALNRDYRSTYRNRLTPGEEVLAGTWPPAGAVSSGGPVPISLEESISKDLGLGMGDEVLFNVQGVPLRAVVSSVRKVDWFHIRPNFFILFPEGVLEEAPQFSVMMARAPSAEASASVQRAAREKFPNVSVVDLRMVLDTVDKYFSKLSVALRTMAFFVLAAGLLILAGTLVSTRYERLREAALLRTLGASSRQIRAVHLVEYGLTGLFSGLAGLVIGGAGSWLVAEFVLKISFNPGLVHAAAGLMSMTAVSAAAGLLLGRGMLNQPPLNILRDETELT